MASRSLARPIIISVLYNLEQLSSSDPQIDEVIEYVISEHSEDNSDVDRDFVVAVVNGVEKKKVILDEIIAKAAPRWTHDMNMVDKAVLRAAIYELLFESDNVPAKVVISQAVSLADKFAAPENRRFVNGVLGTIYREMEAGAQTGDQVVHALDEESGEKIVKHDKVAASVFAKFDGGIWIALVHDVWGYWTFPKGSVQSGMTTAESCAFKVEEEIGIPITIIQELGSNSYQPVQKSPDEHKIVKHVTYFIATAEYQPLELTTSGGLDDVRWFPISKIDKLHMYEDITQMVLKALPIIMQHNFEA